MSHRSSFKAERGFTLVEVLVAISLLAIVLTSVYGIFSGVSAARQRLDRDSDEHHLARVVFDRFGRELQGAYVRQDDPTTFLRGGVNRRGEPFLELTTTAVTPISAAGTGIAEVRYRLAAEPDSARNERVLLRGERARRSGGSSRDDDMMRLAPNVAELSLRFYRDGGWRKEWDAQEDGLPELVEVAILVGRDEGRQAPFRTAFEIPDYDER